MCKLIRKIGMGAVIVAGGLMVLSWLGLSSYPATAFHKFRNSFKKQVPLEFEIERLRYQVAQLVPDMNRNLKTMAEMMVSVDTLREDVKNTRASLDRQRDNILAMTRELESGTATVVYRGKEWSAKRLKEKLATEFQAYQHGEAELKTKEKLLEAKEQELEAAKDQLATMKTQKQEMELEVARLEAELKTVRAAQARSKFQMDNSSLSKCKATLAEIRNRLKVEKTTTDLQNDWENDNGVTQKKTKSTKEITKEVKDYFNDPSVGEGRVADKK